MELNEIDLVEGRVLAALEDKMLQTDDCAVLKVIAMHRGALNAIRATSILSQVGREDDDRGKRWLKSVVEDLVVRLKVPIGASRFSPAGYFLIITQSDLDVAVGPLISEVRSLKKRLTALTSREDIANLFGPAAAEESK